MGHLLADAVGGARIASGAERPLMQALISKRIRMIDYECLTHADGQRILGPETVAAFRSWFENVAAQHNGEYDGWEAAAKP